MHSDWLRAPDDTGLVGKAETDEQGLRVLEGIEHLPTSRLVVRKGFPFSRHGGVVTRGVVRRMRQAAEQGISGCQ